jgi:hypothetical protein
MASTGMLRCVALVRTTVSKELGASIIRVTRIGEIGTTLSVTSNRRTLRACLLTMKNAVFWDMKTKFVLHRRHITCQLQSSVS